MGGGFVCFKRETERECVEEDGKRIVKKRVEKVMLFHSFFLHPEKTLIGYVKKTRINALGQNPI